jgi:hypothetical protein
MCGSYLGSCCHRPLRRGSVTMFRILLSADWQTWCNGRGSRNFVYDSRLYRYPGIPVSGSPCASLKTTLSKPVHRHMTSTALLMRTGCVYFFFFLVAPTSEHRAEFPQFLNLGQSAGLLGRVISSSQGLYLYTNTEKRTHIHKH